MTDFHLHSDNMTESTSDGVSYYQQLWKEQRQLDEQREQKYHAEFMQYHANLQRSQWQQMFMLAIALCFVSASTILQLTLPTSAITLMPATVVEPSIEKTKETLPKQVTE